MIVNMSINGIIEILNRQYDDKRHRTILNTKKGGNIEYAYWLNHQSNDRFRDMLTVGVTSFDNLYTQFKVDRLGNIKYHIDIGTKQVYSKQTNYYLQVKCNNNLGHQQWRFGKTAVSGNTQFHGRLELVGNREWMTSHKVLYESDRVSFGIATVYNISHTKFTRCDWLLNCRLSPINDINLSLKQLSHQKSVHHPLQIDKLICGLNYQVCRGFNTALQVYQDYTSSQFRVEMGCQKRTNDSMWLKAKVDNHTKTTLYYKTKINQWFTGSIHLQFNCRSIP